MAAMNCSGSPDVNCTSAISRDVNGRLPVTSGRSRNRSVQARALSPSAPVPSIARSCDFYTKPKKKNKHKGSLLNLRTRLLPLPSLPYLSHSPPSPPPAPPLLHHTPPASKTNHPGFVLAAPGAADCPLRTRRRGVVPRRREVGWA